MITRVPPGFSEYMLDKYNHAKNKKIAKDGFFLTIYLYNFTISFHSTSCETLCSLYTIFIEEKYSLCNYYRGNIYYLILTQDEIIGYKFY